MADEKDFSKIFSTLDDILANTSLDDVNEEGAGFEQIPDGYYLTEVKKAELTSSKKNDPMAKFKLQIIEDGNSVDYKGDDVILTPVKGTKNRLMFINYVLKDDRSVKRFVADMLKFEGETAGEPLLPKEAFMTSETIIDALDCLVGMRIYAVVSTNTNSDNTTSTWTNLISWKRAAKLGLPL